MKLIKDYNHSTGSTVIFVSHNMDDVASVADRVVVMNKGQVAISGTVEQVYSKGEFLAELGLDVPEITNIFLELKKNGFDLGETAYTVENAKNAILRFLGKGEEI